MLEATQRAAQYVVALRLHPVELLDRIALAREGDHVEQPFALRGVAVALVLLEVAGEPGADRAHCGEPHQAPPDEIAVAVEEGFLLAVDKGGSARMRGDHGVLV